MKKLIYTALLVFLFLYSSLQANPTVQYVGAGKGGTVYLSGVGTVKTGEMIYSPSGIAGISGNFVSFCIEVNEHVRSGSTYDAVLNNAALKGGRGGGSPDPLGNATAWLYNYYLDNVAAAATDSVAKDYQLAIWALEEEVAYNDSAMTVGAKALYNNAVANYSGWNNTNIKVFNLYGLGTYGTQCPRYKQDCLVRVTIPAPSAIVLGGIGAFCVGWIKRRRAL